METSPVLIHIGYPKTASTWLQLEVFLNENTGFCIPWEIVDGCCHKASDLFIHCEQFSAESAQEFFKAGLQEAASRQLIPVVSNEFLCGCFFYNPPNYHNYLGKEVAERLKLVFPNAKVLIMIREQKAILLSAYRQMILMKHTLSMREFLEQDNSFKNHSVSELENLKYDRIISLYQSIFGQDNVLVLPLETLQKNFDVFCQSLFSFIEFPDRQINRKLYINEKRYKNLGLKGSQLVLLQHLNRLLPSQGKFETLSSQLFKVNYKLVQLVAPLISQALDRSVENNLKQLVEEKVGDYFRESNRKTSSLIGINLAELKYPC